MIRMNILLNLFAIVLCISTTKSLFLNKLIPSQSSLISDITKQKYLHTTNLNLNNINDELLLDKIVYLRFDGNSNKRLGSAGFIARLEFVESENSTTSLDLFQGFSWLGTEITSHAAEYWALIKALLYFQAYQHQYLLCLNQKYHLEIQGDSQVLINYLTARNQIYKLRDRKLSILHQYTQCLLQSLNMTVSFQYIPRENNSIADSLARSASISRTSQVSFHPNETTLVLIRAQCNRKYIREVNKLNLCLQFDGSLPMNIINSYLYDLDSLETSNSSDNKKVSNVFPLYIPKLIKTIDIHTSLNLSNCNHEVSSKVDLLSSSEIAFVNANRLFINNEELFHSEYLYINGYDKNCTTNILNAIISPQLFDDQLFVSSLI